MPQEQRAAGKQTSKAWARWSPFQDAKLLSLVKPGTQAVPISKILGTTQSSIRGRCARMKPKDELLSMSEEDQKCAIRWHQEGHFNNIADHLQKIVVTATTSHTGKHIGESEAIRLWTWEHVSPKGRVTSSHDDTPPNGERESTQGGLI